MPSKDLIRVDAATNLAAFASSDEVIARVEWDSDRLVLLVESSVPVEVNAERVTAIHVEVEG